MGIYKVVKDTVAVTITMADGGVLLGYLFLAPQSPAHAGPQTLREILEDPNPFLPVRDTGGDIVLVGKRMVSSIATELLNDPTPEFVRRVPVKVIVHGVGEMVGELVVPEGPAAFRVSDYLNSGETWFRMEDGDKLAMVAGKEIKEIRL